MSDGGDDGGGSSNSELNDSDVDVNCKGVGGNPESVASGGGVNSNGSSGDGSRGNGRHGDTGSDNEDSVNHLSSNEVGSVVDRFHSFVGERSRSGSSTDKVINGQLDRLRRWTHHEGLQLPYNGV